MMRKLIRMYPFLLGATISLLLFSTVSANTSSAYAMPDAFNLPLRSVGQPLLLKQRLNTRLELNNTSSLRQRSLSTKQEVLNYFSSLKGRRLTKSITPYTDASIITDVQRKAFFTLKQNAEKKVVFAEFDKKNGTATFLQGKFKQSTPLKRSKNASLEVSYIAKRFLSDNKLLLKLQSPDVEMQVIKKQTDELGYHHVKFQQMYKGIPVFSKQLSVHLDQSGLPYLMNGRYIPSFNTINVSPLITIDQAKEKLKEHFSPSSIRFFSDKLVIYTKNNKPYLAYQIAVRKSLLEYWDYFIDAKNGQVLHYLNKIQSAAATATGVDEFGVSKSFPVWEDSGSFVMIDTSTMKGSNQPFDSQGGIIRGNIYILDARNTEDDENTQADESQRFYIINSMLNTGWDPSAVGALANSHTIFNYYKNTLNRKSIDNNNFPLVSTIHVGSQYDGAHWDGWSMNYGDGGSVFSSLTRCLDVAAHEVTHGLIQYTAGLIYENQPGALNESFSDVFATMIDSDDWLIGEDCTIAGPGYLRSMKKPSLGLSPQPSKMSEYQNLTIDDDNGGVHVNSGIPNHAAYLVSESIGRSKTESIYYRALTQYLTQSSQFIDARRALIQSATDLYGENTSEVIAVKSAWDKVEVIEGGIGKTTPTQADSISGKDKMYYLYQDNDRAGALFLFEQTMSQDGKYKESGDRRLSLQAASKVRPAPYTNSDGTGVFFVDVNHNIRGVSPQGKLSDPIGNGNISTISISPDKRYFAYTTTDISDNNIHVIDLDKEISNSYKIVITGYQEEGQVRSVMARFADSLSFDYTGKKLIFDMLACTASVSSSCDVKDVNTGTNFWSIGILDLSLDSPNFSFPFPAQSSDINLGYPTFANNNSFIIALDVASASGIKTTIVNFETQKMQEIMSSSDYTVPSFGGDDDTLTVQVPDKIQGSIAASISINKTTWSASGEPSVINPFSVNMPIMHRAGERVLTSKIETNVSNLNFGDVRVGEGKTMTLVLSNKGNYDIDIRGIRVKSDDNVFSLVQGTNTLLPRGAELVIGVKFQSTSSAGSFIGILLIETSGEPKSLSVSLKGNAKKSETSRPPAETPTKDNNPKPSKSGGGAVNVFLFLFLMTLFLFMAYTQGSKKESEKI